MKSSRSSARAAWAKSIGRAIRGSIARSRSRCCRRRSPADPQLRERFEREARAISSLNHPHICALYDIGHQDPSTGSARSFLVLEYLEGRDARRPAGRRRSATDRPAIARGADRLRSRFATRSTRRIGRASSTAISSRPTSSSSAAAGLPPRRSRSCSTSGSRRAPRRSSRRPGCRCCRRRRPNLTAQGTILGTFQYMAPEQIEGLEADARTDIFAFGALLFEMLTGRPAFEGKTRASLLGAILKDEPPRVSTLQPLAPAALDRIISTCLAKDPDERYQSARDLLRDLKWVASGSSDGAARTDGDTASAIEPCRVAGRCVLSTVALIATAVIALRRAGEITPAAGPVQFTIVPPENTSFGGPSGWRNRHRHTGGGVSRWPAHRVRRRRPDPPTRSGCDRSPRWQRRRFRAPKAGPFHSGRRTAGSSGSSRLAN